MITNNNPLTDDTIADLLVTHTDKLAQATMQAFYTLYPDFAIKYKEKQKKAAQQDITYHLISLTAAWRNQSPTSYREYILWVENVLRSRLGSSAYLAPALELMAQTLRQELDEPVWQALQPYVDAGLKGLAEQQNNNTPHALYTNPPAQAVMQTYLRAILKGNRVLAQEVVLESYRQKLSVRKIYLEVFQPALYHIGQLWETGKISVAQEHLATAITQTILAQIYVEADFAPSRNEKAIIACLSDNYHEIGARMVADFLQMHGYDAQFVGANTPDDSLLLLIEENKPDIVGLPSTLAAHIAPVQQIITKIRADFTSYRPTILVGGIAFNLVDGLWQQVGADVWGRDAGETITHLQMG